MYRDIKLNILDVIESELEWEYYTEKYPSLNHLFTTHIDLNRKALILALTSEDDTLLDECEVNLPLMIDIANTHGYKFRIILFEDIPLIRNICDKNHIDQNVIEIINKDQLNGICIGISATYKVRTAKGKPVVCDGVCEQSGEHTCRHTCEQHNVDTHGGQPGEYTCEQPDVQQTYDLRAYQQDVINHMNNNVNPCIVKLPCGMGKSLIMIYHIKEHQQNSIILVPNIALVEQFYNNVRRIFAYYNAPLPEIHRISTMYKELDVIDSSQQQLVISVYNSFVNEFICNNKTPPNNCIAESSFACHVKNCSYKYIYIDEAHHITMPKSERIKKKLETLKKEFDKSMQESDAEMDFGTILGTSPQVKKSFSLLIATYILQHHFLAYYFSATIQNPTITPYTMFDAINDGYLCRLNVDFIVNNYSSTSDRIKDLIDYLNKINYMSIIIYCLRCATALRIKREFDKSSIKSEVIKASVKGDAREMFFDQFREHKLRVLITVNCISEGVDLPCADTAIFFDEKKSIINIIQCVGRIMRLHESKLSSTLAIMLYKCDEPDIREIYENVLKTINGELGYDSIDIKRCVFVRNNTSQAIFRGLMSKIYTAIYKYNREFFNEEAIYEAIEELCNLSKRIDYVPIGVRDYIMNGIDMSDTMRKVLYCNIYKNNQYGKQLRAAFDMSELSREELIAKDGETLNAYYSMIKKDPEFRRQSLSRA